MESAGELTALIILFWLLLDSYMPTYRAVNSPALFIPRGIGESGIATFLFLGEWGIESHSSGNRVGESRNRGIKIFKIIPNKHDFKLDFFVLCME